MIAAEAQYCTLEAELQEYLDNYERTHDYDEYHYDLDDMEHALNRFLITRTFGSSVRPPQIRVLRSRHG